ncbi:MAG: hypothetical protein A2X64_10040 [Ignavibacteria bacterium GWF2_33_9]|nr:MAG: hypothetical protein A2X64_10040 [Ignavibacteria bacterium GWF2_33_9]
MNKFFKYIFVAVVTIFFTSTAFAESPLKVINVKYFHATVRCASCVQIEDFITQTMNLAFQKEIGDSTLRFSSLDFMDPENEPMMEYYGFDTQALIITKVVDGKEVEYKNLELIWDYLSDFSKFEKYVEDEIKAFKD